MEGIDRFKKPEDWGIGVTESMTLSQETLDKMYRLMMDREALDVFGRGCITTYTNNPVIYHVHYQDY